ncbi:GGDEF domain-containing protein [Sphingomonas sp. BK069]|uniref:GGDEF domain-containing protein n=1 Tax=Sphingomonas sp. BK069 TaxID=2586979 RepID=UPI0021A65989|nr:GGDEF domain-containing protein [Sphingomonas sp. BK069]
MVVDRRKRPQGVPDVLVFLDRHRLAHTPDHYAFAHEYLNGDNEQLRERVDGAIDGGVRLTEEQVQELRPAVRAELAPELDHITMRVIDIVGDAMAVTTDLSRELVTASAALLDEPGASAGPLLATMLRRAESAEASFAEAAARARQIRAELSALQLAGQHDPLTGLTNRTAFEARLAGDLRSPTCVALVDVDGLRQVNDGHSPGVGDRLLKVVARALADHARSHLVSRWDGGTFALLIEGMDLRAAGEMVTAACEAIGAREMKVRESDAPLGRISLFAGVVASRGREVEALLKAAWRQLRSAKRNGGNQVSVEGAVTVVR